MNEIEVNTETYPVGLILTTPEIKDEALGSLLARLECTHGSYVKRMSDGRDSIVVRSKEEEVHACYSLMLEAATMLRKQEEELVEDAGAMRVLRRHRKEAEESVERLESLLEFRDKTLMDETRLREEEWREAHVQERIKEYRDRCYVAEDSLLLLEEAIRDAYDDQPDLEGFLPREAWEMALNRIARVPTHLAACESDTSTGADE